MITMISKEDYGGGLELAATSEFVLSKRWGSNGNFVQQWYLISFLKWFVEGCFVND